MAQRRLLIALAHPDDESFGYGGLISRYVAQGVDVYLIVSTDGDVGTVAPEFLQQYGSVRAVRLAELDCAAEILKFKQIFKLGYKDSGMMGSETSQDPACSWQAPPEAMARQVADIIRQVRPQIILTFNKYGGYGHPDHIAIQRATTEAFSLAGDEGYVTNGLNPYQPQKLYYSSPSRFSLAWRIFRLLLNGTNPRKAGRNKDIDIVAILEHVEPTHARVDIKDYLDVWDAAASCHASQLWGSLGRPPMWYRRLLHRGQEFTRVYPTPQSNRVDEHDLFEGIHLDEPVEAV